MRVLPTQLSEKISSLGGLWQAGVADGRIRVMNQSAGHSSLDALNQRIKQQLDPFNLLKGHDHEHAA
jgi:hypothetical protein